VSVGRGSGESRTRSPTFGASGRICPRSRKPSIRNKSRTCRMTLGASCSDLPMRTNCKHCGAETKNPKFCSTSCAAKCNNRKFPKQEPKTRRCEKCGEHWQLSRNKHYSKRNCCPSCVNDNKQTVKTIGDVRAFMSSQGKHPSWIHSHVRQRARMRYKAELSAPCCEICDYRVHVEICHIKPVALFSDDTSLDVVNARTNIRFLCRNHHWEFDHGLLVALCD
jgi:hypothetical protein